MNEDSTEPTERQRVIRLMVAADAAKLNLLATALAYGRAMGEAPSVTERAENMLRAAALEYKAAVVAYRQARGLPALP